MTIFYPGPSPLILCRDAYPLILLHMRPGDKRRLTVPPHLAYGLT